MSMWEFWHEHWFLAFVALILVYSLAKKPFTLANRWIPTSEHCGG